MSHAHDVTHGGTITADQHALMHARENGHGHGHGHGGHEHSHHDDDHGHAHGAHDMDEDDDFKEAKHYTDVCHHMAAYAHHSTHKFDVMVRDFNTLSPFQQSLLPQFHSKQQAIRRAIAQNYQFIRGILSIKQVFWSSPAINYHLLESQPRQLNEERMSKVRTTIRQCVRDWAKEGAAERAQCYGPLLTELSNLFPDVATRGQRRILVPGSGLGRLTWEVANLGFFQSRE